LLVPIPLHRHRESIRGYNQAALLAGQLAAPLNLSVADDILYRTRSRQPQTKVRFEGRQANVAGVFQTMQETSSRSACILVDDVVTTGSTLMEARRVLAAAGYDVVAAISIAHGV
ncbi:MAG: phosphoribosyltransferase family protein, partial [candidate division Zixibacteria bacterium]|nr:phosphoribosyltransferase family protein [candidate division Zixibacteria bacterium]